MGSRLQEAMQEYYARRARQSHPAGIFDKAQRWHPTKEERCECCETIRSPTRAWPYSLMLHCRTIGHVAALYGVDVGELQRAVRGGARQAA